MLPLFTEKTGITHVILAAIHINSEPGNIHLNDDPFDCPKHTPVWEEARILQRAGIKVLGLLGGAAQGTFQRLDGPAADFERYYVPFRKQVEWAQLDGLDLDVEEDMSLAGMVRLIDRLRADFGPDFLLTMAPVRTALSGGRHLSGFSYFELEKAMGRHIAWYNTQFYCNWGEADSTEHYDGIIAKGWDPSKVVLGLVTNPGNGAGYVDGELLMEMLKALRESYPSFGGVMGWEYFNSDMYAQSKPDGKRDKEGNADKGEDASGASGTGGVKRWLWVDSLNKVLNGPREETA